MIDPDDILNIRVLTCKDNARFHTQMIDVTDIDGNQGKIETLRLLHFKQYSYFDILNNISVIQSLNLHKSCKNLLLHIDLTVASHIGHLSQIKNSIESTLKKKYYYSLENVNLLLKLQLGHSHIDWIFSLLKSNVKILKHQFKQLNIGINVCTRYASVYQVIEWNPSVDEKFLTSIQAQMDKRKPNEDTCQDNYYSLLNQWS